MNRSFFTWSFLQSATVAVVQLLQLFIAAWLLSPAELGIWATLTIIYRLLTPVVEGGWTRAIIREGTLLPHQLKTLFTYNFALGCIVKILLSLTAKSISTMFLMPELSTYIHTFSWIFVAIGLGAQSSALLQKELQFKTLAIITAISTIVEAILFLTMLYFGYGIWAMIIPFVTKFFIQQCSFFFITKTPFSFHNDYQSVRHIITFGNYDLAAQLIGYFYVNIDNLLILRYLGKEALGYYSFAWDLTMKPVVFLIPIIVRVTFPVMSKLDDLNPLYQKTIRWIFNIQTPVYLCLFTAGPLFISYFYDEKWSPSIPILQILCIVAWLRAISVLSSSVFAIKGKIKYELYFQIFNTSVTFIFVWLMLSQKNIISIAWGVLMAHIIMISTWHWASQQVGNINYRAILRQNWYWILGIFSLYLWLLLK